ncbi:HAAS signaling domain-containing protein [Arthrobacter agilis]|uniref:HAAS signaling domain-containing protein n=1 Tax=Arthrobacter agilis TaxID=37921 RepID=UPI0027880B3B|nr:hypothetical protein [Arthrobacter agilis]MDQ0734961.1 hypothetical protein [Arthrobacter agilis]
MTTTEPLPALLEAYFADLDRALIGTDARERAETIQAMREHAAEMLTRDGASDNTAERIVADFGPVEQVAAAATSAPIAARSWVDVWLLVGSIVSLVFYVFPFVAFAILVWAIVRLRQASGNRALQRAACWVSAVSVVFSACLFISHLVHAL